MKPTEESKKLRNPTDEFPFLTIGRVVDTNDPQEMGRIRAVCPFLGDSFDLPIEYIPWATYVSPFAGTMNVGKRGREEVESDGFISYGMFNVPKIGAQVLIACLEGDPKIRLWLGCINEQMLVNTMPHGRYTFNEKTDGPFTSSSNPLEPLYKNIEKTFTKSKDTINSGIPEDPKNNFEFITRGSDSGVAGIKNVFVEEGTLITEPDDREVKIEQNGKVFTYGYKRAILKVDKEGLENYLDPQVYSWTTPGFHAISMDDSSDNCKIKIRTTSGHQVIMDDTNERIYINTAGGDTWIELDEKGNIDIYGKRNISVHAEKDINFTADENFRVTAKKGIHLDSETVRITANNNIDIKSKSGVLHLESSGDFHILSNSSFFITTSSEAHFKSGSSMILEGSTIDFNGPPAQSASPAVEAWLTSRVPEHEPWPRVMTDPSKTDNDYNNTHNNAAEFSYDDENVGKIERGESLNRNEKWSR